jgi:small-conductance mechanosensitive channel
MAELGDNFDSDYEPPAKDRPWGLIAGVIAFVVLGALAFWATHEKKNDEARQQVLAAMDKDLTADEDAIKAQREKFMELNRQLEVLRASIQAGTEKNGKAAVAQYNKLAAQQRAEREKFAQMADAYNKKVAEFRKLEQ